MELLKLSNADGTKKSIYSMKMLCRHMEENEAVCRNELLRYLQPEGGFAEWYEQLRPVQKECELFKGGIPDRKEAAIILEGIFRAGKAEDSSEVYESLRKVQDDISRLSQYETELAETADEALSRIQLERKRQGLAERGAVFLSSQREWEDYLESGNLLLDASVLLMKLEDEVYRFPGVLPVPGERIRIHGIGSPILEIDREESLEWLADHTILSGSIILRGGALSGSFFSEHIVGAEYNKASLFRLRKEGWRGYAHADGRISVQLKDALYSGLYDGIIFWEGEGKKGYIDIWGKAISSGEYKPEGPFYENRACVLNQGKYGYIDSTGALVIPCRYSEPQIFTEGLAVVSDEESGLEGMIDKGGNMKIPCIYESLGGSSEGYVTAQFGGAYGFLDGEGNVVIPFQYAYASAFSHGLAIVTFEEGGDQESKQGIWGFINTRGEEVTPCIYDLPEDYWELFENGLGVLSRKGRYGCITKAGTEVIPFVYETAREVESLIEENELSEASIFPLCREGMWGYVDKYGKAVVPFQYEYADYLRENRGRIRDKGKWGYVNKAGAAAVPCIYEKAEDFKEGLAFVWTEGSWQSINYDGEIVDSGFEIRRFGRYFEGRARGRRGLCGYLDEQGQEAVPFIYGYVAEAFADGWASVRRSGRFDNGLWGMVDRFGNEVIPCSCPEDLRTGRLGSFREGLAPVRCDDAWGLPGALCGAYPGYWGYVDREGRLAIPDKYDDAKPFSNGLAQVRIKDRWGYIDVRGNTAVPCIYEACEPFRDGTAKVRRDGRWGLLNSQGEEILPCEYDTLEKEEAVVIHYLHTGRDTTLIIEKGRHIDEQKS